MPARGDLITKRKDGRYMARYTVQTPDGPKRKTIYGKKYKEIEKKLAEARGDAARGIVYDDENMTVGEWLIMWVQNSVKGNVGPGTYHQYGVHVRHHIIPALGRMKLSRLTAAHIQSVYAQKLRNGLAPATVRLTHAVLHRALNQAVRFNLIPWNPAGRVDPPKVSQEEITPLNSEQARVLLDTGKGDRLEALYVISLTVGLRIGEALGLKWSDIDLDTGTLRVNRQLQRYTGKGFVFSEPKHGRRRTVDLPHRAVEALRSHRKRQVEEQLRAGARWADNGLVFPSGHGTPLDARNVANKHFKPVLKRAGLPDIRFHDLRHTCATLLLGRGVYPKYVQHLLGHKSIKLTLDR
jgi:integrase